MALARSRAAARRVKDRWKAKQWYNVMTPVSFSSKNIGETFADEPEKLIGRTAETTLQDLTGDMKQMHVKLFFRVHDIVDNEARTQFIGHTMTSDYVRRLTRRGHTKIQAVFDLKTKDGSRVRVKPFAVTDRRAQTTSVQQIRKIMQDMMTECAAENTLTGFLKEVLVGDLTSRIYKEGRKIHPLRRVEVAKTEILNAPAVEVDETPIIVEPEPEPEPSEDDAVELEGTEDSEEESVEASADSEEE